MTACYRGDHYEANPVFERTTLDAIMDCMEFTCHQFLPKANAYMSLYIPVQKAIGNW